MNNLSTTLTESMAHLGQGFLLAYYLPAAAFLIASLTLFSPVWSGVTAVAAGPPATAPTAPAAEAVTVEPPQSGSETPETTTPAAGWVAALFDDLGLDTLIWTLFTPLLLGILLLGLNSVLIAVLEGKPAWLRQGLLGWRTRRNEWRREKLYSALQVLREQYLHTIGQLWQAQSPGEQESLQQTLAGLQRDIHAEHARIEASQLVQTLPRDAHRIKPTAFGNSFAMAEEYAYERYGIDSVLFWPRLRKRMAETEAAATHVAQLTDQKTMLDLAVNLVYLAAVFALEALVLWIVASVRGIAMGFTLVGSAAVALILCLAFYQASLAAVRTLGELIRISFDAYRGLVLASFDLAIPADTYLEQMLWLRLAMFVRWGDPFYLAEARLVSADAKKEA